MVRQTPSRGLRVVALVVAGGLGLATAALAATSTAPRGTYGGYGGGYGSGYGSTTPSDGFGSDNDPSGQPDEGSKPKKDKKEKGEKEAR